MLEHGQLVCVGRNPPARCALAVRRDHPRMRGENQLAAQLHSKQAGSPPHARGKLAHIGQFVAKSMDHPRMRGENHRGGLGQLKATGSPPHARGKCRSP